MWLAALRRPGGSLPSLVYVLGTDVQKVIAGKYRADVADIWSAGVVLFTLLVGNTPWDEPTNRSLEYGMYVACKGRPVYDPWPEVPTEVLCLLPAP